MLLVYSTGSSFPVGVNPATLYWFLYEFGQVPFSALAQAEDSFFVYGTDTVH